MLCVVVVLVVVVVVEEGEEGGERRRGGTIWAKVTLKIAQTEQPCNHPVADSLHSVPRELELTNFIR